jgi:hypothetical protein
MIIIKAGTSEPSTPIGGSTGGRGGVLGLMEDLADEQLVVATG